MKDSLEMNPFLTERNGNAILIVGFREIEAGGHFPLLMAEGSDEGTFESRFAKALDSIDEVSKNIEQSIKQRRENKSDEKGDLEHSEGTNKEREDSVISKVKESAGNTGRKITTSVQNADLASKASSIGSVAKGVASKSVSAFKQVATHLPYIIPATVIFQTALWLAYFSESSISGDIVRPIAENLGESSRAIAILITIFGGIGAYLISSTFDSSLHFGEFSIMPEVVDVMVVFLTLSAFLYLFKKFQSLYYLSLVMIGSFVIRMVDVTGSSYDLVSISSMVIGMICFFSVLSIPMFRGRSSQRSKESEIDTSAILDIVDEIAESSYSGADVDMAGNYMEQAPVTKPKRPSRRSEYELYEWVLLLANLILWPGVVIISIILGSGTEVAGGTYNLEENYLMLVGPLLLTLFFFTLLFKMDANARDGSLYAAEKQSYLDEMDKYLEARTAYLELVTLQAQMKKQQIRDGSAEE